MKYWTTKNWIWNSHVADTKLGNVSAKQTELNRWYVTDGRWNKNTVSRESVQLSPRSNAFRYVPGTFGYWHSWGHCINLGANVPRKKTGGNLFEKLGKIIFIAYCTSARSVLWRLKCTKFVFRRSGLRWGTRRSPIPSSRLEKGMRPPYSSTAWRLGASSRRLRLTGKTCSNSKDLGGYGRPWQGGRGLNNSCYTAAHAVGLIGLTWLKQGWRHTFSLSACSLSFACHYPSNPSIYEKFLLSPT